MKKRRTALFASAVTVLFLLASSVGAAVVGANPRLGVLGVSAPRSTWATDYVHNLIIHDVTALGRFEVIERSEINAILREQRKLAVVYALAQP